jgi:hypothetical protein
MKITQKKQKIPKKVYLTAIALLIIGGAGAFGLYQSQQATHRSGTEIRPVNDVDYNPPSPAEQQQKEDTKEETIKKNDQANTPPPANSPITVTVSRVNQGGTGLPLNVRTIISGANTGTCTVELKKDGQPTVTKTFTIGVEATYATCQQADVPATAFSVSGEWTYSVIAKNNTTESQAATGSVTITK